MKINFSHTRIISWLIVGFTFISLSGIAQKQYKYETYPNDPLHARIYTLDNGLKVYMTVYKDAPRVQAFIAVKAGSKNDPHETTGLAHYFEHMMFKGTKNFGTANYEDEAPLIQQIEDLFEQYRQLTDEEERKALYKIIDSISFKASKYAIPNEYDKLMSIIGSTGTNAFTSLDQTVYVENIPSNQIENWAIIQADRFTSPVLRLFHTELETIYEEKNMTMTSDARKAYTAMLEGLFQKHTYGTQTTIGTQEHIKNPSMKNIRWFFDNYYVPNNMAICLSGDFDMDATIQIIDKYFGKLQRHPVPPFQYEPEEPVNQPIVKEVVGPDAENISIAFRLPGATDLVTDKLKLFDMILTNSKAGLIDINLNQKQKVLSASTYPMIMRDYSAFVLTGKPKEGQTLDDVKNLLLEQIELVKKGEFPDWLIPAIINDFALNEYKQYENNNSRAMAFVNSFILDIPWEVKINELERMKKITKEDIVEFANKYFSNNYVVVYKRTGKDESIKKIKKNKLTPLQINRDAQSAFLRQIQANTVPDIEPVFIDYNKDIVKNKLKSNIELLYRPNEENPTFMLYYVFDMGSNHDKKLNFAIDYLEYLGTTKFSPEKIKEEFYKLGTSFSVSSSDDQIYVQLTGLTDNLEPALQLFEELLADCQPNKEALANLVSDELKNRADAKKNIQQIFGQLVVYGIYGPKNPATNMLSEAELKALTADELVAKIHGLNSYEHKVLFYGSRSIDEVSNLLNQYHRVPDALKPLPAETKFPELPTKKTQIYVVNFDTKQAQILMLTQGNLFMKDKLPVIRLFNEYFGGSMNSIVFQELREARALCYTAMSFFQNPQKADKHHYTLSYIATQYDKMAESMTAIYDLLNNMPESEKSFQLAKNSIIQNIRSERITKEKILFRYLAAKDLGIDYDTRIEVFKQVPGLTMNDIKTFQTQYIKDKPKTILILGDVKEIDMKLLKKYGKVKTLELKEIFGY